MQAHYVKRTSDFDMPLRAKHTNYSLSSNYDQKDCPSEHLCESMVIKLGPAYSSAKPSAQFCKPNAVCHWATQGKYVLYIARMDFLLRFVLVNIIHSTLTLLNLLEQVKASTYLV